MFFSRRTVFRLALVAVAGMAFWALPSAAQAKTIKVASSGSTTSIQNAIEAAAPGDTVSVAPGTYTGPTVRVTKNDLTITGSPAATIDATGNQFGITVGSILEFEPGPTCPAFTVKNFKINGLTVENAEETGIFLFGVDGFEVSGGRYVDNGEYGIFPRCSHNGLIAKNSGGGGDDATIYVGVDHNVTVEDNNLTNGELGIELESTNESIVRGNKLKENTAAIFVIVLPGLPKATTEGALIENNVVQKNNRPNPFPPLCEGREIPGCTEEFTDDLQLLPSGTGILNVGGSDVTIRNNQITNNGTVGVGVVQNPFLGNSSERTVVTSNTIQQNGKAVDPRSSGSGDFVYLDNPANGSCFSGNVFKTEFAPFGAPPPCS